MGSKILSGFFPVPGLIETTDLFETDAFLSIFACSVLDSFEGSCLFSLCLDCSLEGSFLGSGCFSICLGASFFSSGLPDSLFFFSSAFFFLISKYFWINLLLSFPLVAALWNDCKK